MAPLLIGQIAALTRKMTTLDKDIRRRAAQHEQVARLVTVPSVGHGGLRLLTGNDRLQKGPWFRGLDRAGHRGHFSSVVR